MIFWLVDVREVIFCNMDRIQVHDVMIHTKKYHIVHIYYNHYIITKSYIHITMLSLSIYIISGQTLLFYCLLFYSVIFNIKLFIMKWPLTFVCFLFTERWSYQVCSSLEAIHVHRNSYLFSANGNVANHCSFTDYIKDYTISNIC